MAKTSLLALLAASLVAVSASPTPQVPSDPAEVEFTPYAGPGCDMSTDPFDTTKPVRYVLGPSSLAHVSSLTASHSYNVTSGTCFTPPYAFDSYVEQANDLAANGPCTVAIYSEPGCTGESRCFPFSFFPASLVSSNKRYRMPVADT